MSTLGALTEMNTQEFVRLHQSPLSSATAKVLILVTVSIGLVLSCAKDEALAPMVDAPIGANQQTLPNAAAVGALINSAGQVTGCSVAFIGERFAITAARCISQANPALYSVSLSSPFSPTAPRLGLATIVIHPLWNGSVELNQSQAHLASLRQGQPGYYSSAPSYDIAVLTFSTPKGDQVFLDPCPEPAPSML